MRYVDCFVQLLFVCIVFVPILWQNCFFFIATFYFIDITRSFVFCFQLALYVLSFLEPRDLIRASQTCRYWRTLAEDNLLWREKCQEEGLSESFVFGHRFNGRRPVRPRCNVADRNGMTQWKYIYRRQRQIENNWSHGSLRAQKVGNIKLSVDV